MKTDKGELARIAVVVDTTMVRDVLLHAIGMSSRNYRRKLDWWLDNDNHRNSFATLPGCDGWEAIQYLVSYGLMREGKPYPGGMRFFFVTPLGIEVAKIKYPKLAPKPKAGKA